MSATLQLSRPFRLVDGGPQLLPYRIVLDGQMVGKIANRSSTEIQIEAGTHTLKVIFYLGLKSPTMTVDVSDGEAVGFVCHARPFVLVVPWLIASLFHHSSWIVLKRA